jgi:hypothetical protein
MPYAQGTEVPVARSRGHIEELLTQYKADSIGIMTESVPPRATVVFRINSWAVRMRIPLPTPDDFKQGNRQRKDLALKRCEQAHRERWRQFFLALKAKLVSVESGVETFEEAFLPHLVLPGGGTVFEKVRGNLGSGDIDLPQLGSGQ